MNLKKQVLNIPAIDITMNTLYNNSQTSLIKIFGWKIFYEIIIFSSSADQLMIFLTQPLILVAFHLIGRLTLLRLAIKSLELIVQVHVVRKETKASEKSSISNQERRRRCYIAVSTSRDNRLEE